MKTLSHFRHIEDIDLFTGGLSEIPLSDLDLGPKAQGHPGILGPTFACIIAEQFSHLRKCDRFWFETSEDRLGFSIEQLDEVRKATLSGLVCANVDVQTPLPR